VASHYEVDNLTAIIDRNHLSLDGETEKIMALEPFADRWRCCGWNAIGVDGHDFLQIHGALRQAQEARSRPTVLIADTVKGRGVSFMEGRYDYHYAVLSEEELEMTRSELARQI
jgi:transketolase